MRITQNIYGQCLGASGPLGGSYGLNYAGVSPAAAAGLAAPYGLGAGLAASPFGLSPAAIELGVFGPYGVSPAAVEVAGAYGGAGIGDVVVVGEMPAAGSVSIAGSCGCGCNAAYLY
ncbi:unnamed protein product, partial [Brenthis ino]